VGHLTRRSGAPKGDTWQLNIRFRPNQLTCKERKPRLAVLLCSTTATFNAPRTLGPPANQRMPTGATTSTDAAMRFTRRGTGGGRRRSPTRWKGVARAGAVQRHTPRGGALDGLLQLGPYYATTEAAPIGHLHAQPVARVTVFGAVRGTIHVAPYSIHRARRKQRLLILYQTFIRAGERVPIDTAVNLDRLRSVR
jgi:hypothetical protein